LFHNHHHRRQRSPHCRLIATAPSSSPPLRSSPSPSPLAVPAPIRCLQTRTKWQRHVINGTSVNCDGTSCHVADSDVATKRTTNSISSFVMVVNTTCTLVSAPPPSS
jgi:hypothetical protein